MKEDFTIREAQQSDAVALKELFQNTVIHNPKLKTGHRAEIISLK